MRLANLNHSKLDSVVMCEVNAEQSNIAECKLIRVEFKDVKMNRASFFGTALKGLDLTKTELQGIMVSDSFWELQGVTIDACQAAEVIQLLGVIVSY